MFTRISLVLCVVFMVASVCAHPVPAKDAPPTVMTFTDDTGRQIEVEVPVKRAVVSNRYGVEFVRAIAGMDPIVGVDGYLLKDTGVETFWPTLTADMVTHDNQRTLHYETIVEKQADVVILPRNGAYQEAIEKLEPFGIPVLVITAWDVLKHVDNITMLGQLFGEPERAEELNEFYLSYIDLLKDRLEGVEPRTVYFEEVQDYRTCLVGSGWHDMIETGGGVNLFGDIQIGDQPQSRGTVHKFEIDPEEIIERNPDIIVKLQPRSYPPHSKEESAKVLQELIERPGFSEITAVKEGRVYLINYYIAGGCSKITGALQIAKWLYPEQFADIDPGQEAMKVWFEKFQGVPYPGGYTFGMDDM